ncbi:MAG: single-stranded DNA-binding protein [Ruminococcaceae bacterium]|nr:single-stranded DNA-binding protein [Oscillospiraceae bacterium]
MASLNKVLLIGNITADPELKSTTNGKSVCNFSIAVNRPFVKEGSKVQDVDFINVTAWGKTAEFVAAYFAKGEPIFICGALQVRSWNDSDGTKRYATEVNADEVSFVRSKPQNTAEGGTNEKN